MMMRADEGYTPNEKCSLEEMVACALADDTDACLAKCTGNEGEEEDPEEVKAGTLNVTMKSEEGGEFPSRMSSFPVATYTLKATDEDINVTSLVIKEGGYADEGRLKAALFINGVRVSKTRDLTKADTEYTINLSSAYTIKAGKSVDIELRVSDATTKNADQYNITLVDVNSSAEKVKLPSNVKTNTFKVLDVKDSSNVDVALADVDDPKVGSKNVDIFEFVLDNKDTSHDVDFNAITFVAKDKDMADYLENLQLVVDGEVIANAEMNGKYLTFVLKNAYTIEKGQNPTFTVKADVVGGAGVAGLGFDFENVFDLTATAKAYDAPVYTTVSAKSATLKVSAGRVTIERANPSTTTFVNKAKNVYLGSFTINNNAGGKLTLNGFTLDLEKVGATALADYIDTIKVRYGSTSAGLISLEKVDNTKAQWTAEDDQAIGNKLTVYVYADIDDCNTIETSSFKMSLSNIDIEEDTEGEDVTDISMPASWLTMKGTKATATISNIVLGPKNFAKGTSDVEAAKFTVKTNSTDGVKIKNMTFSATSEAISDVKGEYTITLKDTWADNDKVTIDSQTVTLTAVNTPATIKSDIEGNATLDAKYTVAVAGKVITLTQKVGSATAPTVSETTAGDGTAVLATVSAGADAVAQGGLTVGTKTIRRAVLDVNGEEYNVTVSDNKIKLSNAITLEKDTTTTFTLKVDLTSNPDVTEGFSYKITAMEANDTSADKNVMDLSAEFAKVQGRVISIASEGTLNVSLATTEVNDYDKSILAGNTGTIVEYNVKANYEEVNTDEIVVTFNKDVAARVDNVELYYGDKLVASNPTIATTTATFTNVDLDLSTTKTPLSVVVSTIAFDDSTDVALQDVTATVTLKELVGKETGNGLTDEAGAASKEFDIVPAKIIPTITAVDSTSSELNLFVDKGENTTDDGEEIVTKGLTLVFSSSTNTQGLTSIVITDKDNQEICTTSPVAQAASMTCTIANAKQLLKEGNNKFTVTYYLGTATNPTYSVNLTEATYKVDTTTIDSIRLGKALNMLKVSE